MVDKSAVASEHVSTQGGPLPKQIHRQVENNQKDTFAATTKPLLKFQGVQLAQAQPVVHRLFEDQKTAEPMRGRNSPPRYQARHIKNQSEASDKIENDSTNSRRLLTVDIESTTSSLLKKTKDLSRSRRRSEQRNSPTSISAMHTVEHLDSVETGLMRGHISQVGQHESRLNSAKRSNS